MKEIFVRVLGPLSDFFFQLVLLIPLWSVKWLFLSVFLILILWVWRLPAEGPETSGHWVSALAGDLRIWATGILLIQIVIYLMLG